MKKKTFVITIICIPLLSGAFAAVNALVPSAAVGEGSDAREQNMTQVMNERCLAAALGTGDSDTVFLDAMLPVDEAKVFRYEFYAAYPEITLGYSPRFGMKGYSPDAELCIGYSVTKLPGDSGKARYEELTGATEDLIYMLRNMPDAGKVAAAKLWIAAHCEYTKTPVNMWDESMYGCLVKGTATCLGYSEGFYYLMRQLHVPCRIVTDKYHAWNEVYTGGRWKKVDTTGS